MKCNDCGANFLDCDCDDDIEEWYDIEDIQPNPGQLCDIKCVVTMRAIYNHKELSNWEKYDDNMYETADVIAWRAV